MDLIYMSDAMAYQSYRGPLSYYDRSWENKNSKKSQGKNYKTSSTLISDKSAVGNKSKAHNKSSGSVCKICQEQQRRTLKGYIRSKSHEERGERIVEENEEEEDNECSQKHNDNEQKHT